MIYRPAGNRFLWDSWLFPWNDQFHLFFLESSVRNGERDRIGHAVSSDLVAWRDFPSIAVPRGQVDRWDHRPTLTGTVVRNGDAFWMFYGASAQKSQRIGLMKSNDLIEWQPYHANPVLTAQPPFYMGSPDSNGNRVPWRDPCVTWRDDWNAFEALVCATALESNESDCGACIARCRSTDLIEWQLCAPAARVGTRFIEAEVPDYFELEGRHYILFSSQDGFGAPLSFPRWQRTTGIYYLMSDERDGTYQLPDHPLLLGAGHSRKDAYVGRTFEHRGQRMMYHHHFGPQPIWGTVKVVQATRNGELRLGYWPGIEKLHGTETLIGLDGAMEMSNEIGSGRWQANGDRLFGTAGMRDTSTFLAETHSDFHLACKLRLSNAVRASLIFRRSRTSLDEAKRGVVITVDAANQMVEWGTLGFSDVNIVQDAVHWPLANRNSCQMRLLARGEYFELYIDNECVFSACIDTAPRTGNLGFAVQGGDLVVTELKMFELMPLS